MMHHDSQRPAYQLEKYSSAISLADMEIFVFPELLFSLVLANIMSPRVWAWKEDPWFRKIKKMSPYRRILRLKQYIIDHYDFNLDLDTWGLTTKDAELDRFKSFIDLDILNQSNALFGYEGDKYYFDLDIRRHFGLDKYTSDVIPYWKTETLEAMDAFRHKEGYTEGAGECVSLSTLYAAALFVVCEIPLEDIFLLATPLHSQNFVAVREGIVTNNRRIVTKKMWYNGTELTSRAQRALRNEQVTIVANNTGYVHTMYPEATMDRSSYDQGTAALKDYLHTDVDASIIACFLRQESRFQKCFQFRHDYHGRHRYIAAEKVYAYEHISPFRVSDDTREKLLVEIDEYEFYAEPIEGRILFSKFDDFFVQHPRVDFRKNKELQLLLDEFSCTCCHAHEIGKALLEFVYIDPRLPHPGKQFVETPTIELEAGIERDAMMAKLESLRKTHPVADLAFYAYRDMARCDWKPFLKAAFERNPACVEAAKDLSDDALIARLQEWPNESIYDAGRMAQPDEVWNFERGDGAERALCLTHILRQRHPQQTITLSIQPDQATLTAGEHILEFPSGKGLTQEV